MNEIAQRCRMATRDMSDGLPSLAVPLTTFVGREAEVDQVRRLLNSTRLLTLTGAGGVGKTRLALEAAGPRWPAGVDEVVFIDLAPLTDPALVPQAVAAEVGVRDEPGRPPLETLVRALARRRLLLILDNCEHVVLACSLLAEAVLRACPQVRILATSRERLGVGGEMAWRVPSLSVPDPGAGGHILSLEQSF